MLDPRVLDSLRALGGDDEPGLFRELIETFLADAPARLAAIASAGRAGDAAMMFREAHGLKSGAANIGALVLADVCVRLEQAARVGDTAAFPTLLGELETVRAGTDAALRALLA